MNGFRLVYNNTGILCVCVSVRLFVCLFVCFSLARSLGTGRRSATLFAPTRKAPPGELHKPLLEWMRRACGEIKALESFPPLRVEAAVYPWKWAERLDY